jgi:hypothetical protein
VRGCIRFGTKRGEIVTAILRLQHKEHVRLDHSQLKVLYQSLGPAGADKVLAHALDDLSTTLVTAAEHYRLGEIEPLRAAVKTVIALAQQVGMTMLARVGRDVLALSQTYDAAAFGATMARFERIGEGSLMAVWDLQDLSL